MKRGPIHKNPDKGYTVVSCPRNEFAEGAQFHMSQFNYTLKMGNWPVGMVVEKDGKKYVVRYVLREIGSRNFVV